MTDKVIGQARHIAGVIQTIDETFSAGYVRNNPLLVASLVEGIPIEAAVATGYCAHREAHAAARKLYGEIEETIVKLQSTGCRVLRRVVRAPPPQPRGPPDAPDRHASR